MHGVAHLPISTQHRISKGGRLSPVRPSVRLSVCHTGGSVKNG